MPRETVYDEIEIEDFTWDPRANVFHYPCPCGDRFEISKSQLRDGEDIATCPSCSLIVRVIYEWVSTGVIDGRIRVLI
jgi:diphthamide biosynthesis protein 3